MDLVTEGSSTQANKDGVSPVSPFSSTSAAGASTADPANDDDDEEDTEEGQELADVTKRPDAEETGSSSSQTSPAAPAAEETKTSVKETTTRQVSREDAEAYAREAGGLLFFEASAKTGKGVQEIFTEIGTFSLPPSRPAFFVRD